MGNKGVTAKLDRITHLDAVLYFDGRCFYLGAVWPDLPLTHSPLPSPPRPPPRLPFSTLFLRPPRFATVVFPLSARVASLHRSGVHDASHVPPPPFSVPHFVPFPLPLPPALEFGTQAEQPEEGRKKKNGKLTTSR